MTKLQVKVMDKRMTLDTGIAKSHCIETQEEFMDIKQSNTVIPLTKSYSHPSHKPNILISRTSNRLISITESGSGSMLMSRMSSKFSTDKMNFHRCQRSVN